MNQKKTLEINPRHPLMKELLRRVEVHYVTLHHMLCQMLQEDDQDQTTIDLAQVMLDTAVLRSGYDLQV